MPPPGGWEPSVVSRIQQSPALRRIRPWGLTSAAFKRKTTKKSHAFDDSVFQRKLKKNQKESKKLSPQNTQRQKRWGQWRGRGRLPVPSTSLWDAGMDLTCEDVPREM